MDTLRAGWCPPHCPNPNCRYHNGVRTTWRFKRKGFFSRRSRPHRVQRYACLHCGRTFSSQTFSTTYWQKRPQLMLESFWLVVGCMANRQMARALKCAPSTMAHHITRLARHCLLFQAEELAKTRASGEVVIDGFESFEWSQYFPFHHNVAVEADTGYFLFHTDSPLRRKGRMTERQRERRCQLEDRYGRPDPKAVRNGIAELLQTVTRDLGEVVIRSDDHRSYPPAMRGLGCRVAHQVTSSKVRRDRGNRLVEINLLDLMIRHSTAAHRRETIAWAKRRQASAEKLTIFQVWRNYVKRRWEKGPPVSSAMLKGLAHRLLEPKELLLHRYFRTRMDLPARWSLYYDRRVSTPAMGVNRFHNLTYAY